MARNYLQIGVSFFDEVILAWAGEVFGSLCLRREGFRFRGGYEE